MGLFAMTGVFWIFTGVFYGEKYRKESDSGRGAAKDPG